mmetsp:Transcript_17842/g.41642  ORF Transcript_17842/g.41642 Transcript_17842/m.41642 type:complete len:262 (+) Transcript_17842:2289-3074(+)
MVRVVQALGEVPPNRRVGGGVVHVAVMEARLERTAGRPVEVSPPAAGVPVPGPAGRQDALVAPEQGRGPRALPGPQSPERAQGRLVVGTDEGAHPRLRGGRPLRLLPVLVLRVRRAFPRAVRLVAGRPDEPAAFPPAAAEVEVPRAPRREGLGVRGGVGRERAAVQRGAGRRGRGGRAAATPPGRRAGGQDRRADVVHGPALPAAGRGEVDRPEGVRPRPRGGGQLDVVVRGRRRGRRGVHHRSALSGRFRRAAVLFRFIC